MILVKILGFISFTIFFIPVGIVWILKEGITTSWFYWNKFISDMLWEKK